MGENRKNTILCNPKRFSVAFKRGVVQEIENGTLNIAGAGRKYKIEGHSTISRWLQKYSLYNYIGLGKKNSMNDNQTDAISVLEENKNLKKQIQLLQTKILCQETMLELAEEHYGEPIRKNFFAKRLKK